jgi:hypothetical protein
MVMVYSEILRYTRPVVKVPLRLFADSTDAFLLIEQFFVLLQRQTVALLQIGILDTIPVALRPLTVLLVVVFAAAVAPGFARFVTAENRA